ncbi:MAG: MraY family glycosyltransferase [bacterium]|nr:MraY family glycosyltransferase [bacterium]
MTGPFFSFFLQPLFFSFLIAFFVTIIIIKIAPKLGLIDDPQKNKHANVTHAYPVPRGGGIPIFAALLIISILLLPLDKHLVGILIGAFLAVAIGVLDDRFNLNPYLRLATCFLAAGSVVAAGIGIAFITNPFGGIINLSEPRITFELLGETRNIWLFSSLFALLWIAWCMNFIGWSGGVEGQLPGFVAIAAITIGILSLQFTGDATQWPTIVLAAITAGAYLGFLPFNFYPQKIMPGYSGKSLAGFLLGVLSILAAAKVGTLIVVLGLPLLDAIYSLARRILSGKSPVWGDRGHLHHRLLDMGWGKRKVVFFYWAVTALLGILALNLNSQQKFYTIVALAVILGGFFIWVGYFTKSRAPQDRSSG